MIMATDPFHQQRKKGSRKDGGRNGGGETLGLGVVQDIEGQAADWSHPAEDQQVPSLLHHPCAHAVDGSFPP